LLSTFLAAANLPGHPPAIGQVLLILLCMVTARTLAMAANRLLDARLDKVNPRTARRAIPSGALSPAFYVTISLLCIAGFFAGCWGFDFWYANPCRCAWALLFLFSSAATRS
jgi:4-hydroxybenzoate polyprenyltransferase